jgi:hypothetical protein
MDSFLSENVAIDRCLDAVAAGTTVQSGAGVDMAGYDGVLFIACFGALTANQVTSLQAEQSSDDAVADAYTDIEDSNTANLADGDGTDMLVLDVFRPQERYVRPVVLRATANAVIDSVIAIRYRAKDVPITQGARAIDLVKIADPVAGTA